MVDKITIPGTIFVRMFMEADSRVKPFVSLILGDGHPYVPRNEYNVTSGGEDANVNIEPDETFETFSVVDQVRIDGFTANLVILRHSDNTIFASENYSYPTFLERKFVEQNMSFSEVKYTQETVIVQKYYKP